MRLLVFTDSNGSVNAPLIEAMVSLIRETDGIEVCGFVTSRPHKFQPNRHRAARRLARHALISAANRSVRLWRDRPRLLDDRWLLRERIPLFVPPEGNANDPAFLEFLRRDVRPTVAFSCYCRRIFKAPLLQLFEQTVNFHNGLLPRYKGLGATEFSLYAGDAHTGFTFHRMTESIDAGPILLQERVPVAAEDGLRDVSRKLTATAVASVPRVLELVLANDPGRPQRGEGSYFSAGDVFAMTRVEHPEQLTEEELRRRLRAFGTLWISIGGRRYPVTRLRRATARQSLSFRAADGAVLSPDRLRQLPPVLDRLGERLRRGSELRGARAL